MPAPCGTEALRAVSSVKGSCEEELAQPRPAREEKKLPPVLPRLLTFYDLGFSCPRRAWQQWVWTCSPWGSWRAWWESDKGPWGVGQT